MQTRRAFQRALVPASALSLFFAPPALAGEEPQALVTADGAAVIFTAADGQANHLTVRMSRGETVDEHYY